MVTLKGHHKEANLQAFIHRFKTTSILPTQQVPQQYVFKIVTVDVTFEHKSFHIIHTGPKSPFHSIPHVIYGWFVIVHSGCEMASVIDESM